MHIRTQSMRPYEYLPIPPQAVWQKSACVSGPAAPASSHACSMCQSAITHACSMCRSAIMLFASRNASAHTVVERGRCLRTCMMQACMCAYIRTYIRSYIDHHITMCTQVYWIMVSCSTYTYGIYSTYT